MVSIISFAIGVFILYILGSILMIPIKILFKLLGSVIIGGLLLVGFNLIGGLIGLSLVITPLAAIVVGILGIPGILLLLLFKNI